MEWKEVFYKYYNSQEEYENERRKIDIMCYYNFKFLMRGIKNSQYEALKKAKGKTDIKIAQLWYKYYKAINEGLEKYQFDIFNYMTDTAYDKFINNMGWTNNERKKSMLRSISSLCAYAEAFNKSHKEVLDTYTMQEYIIDNSKEFNTNIYKQLGLDDEFFIENGVSPELSNQIDRMLQGEEIDKSALVLPNNDLQNTKQPSSLDYNTPVTRRGGKRG